MRKAFKRFFDRVTVFDNCTFAIHVQRRAELFCNFGERNLFTGEGISSIKKRIHGLDYDASENTRVFAGLFEFINEKYL